MDKYNDARQLLNIGRGLESVGEPRFGTIYWSLQSIRRGLPAFRLIVADKSLGIDITVSSYQFLIRRSSLQNTSPVLTQICRD